MCQHFTVPGLKTLCLGHVGETTPPPFSTFWRSRYSFWRRACIAGAEPRLAVGEAGRGCRNGSDPRLRCSQLYDGNHRLRRRGHDRLSELHAWRLKCVFQHATVVDCWEFMTLSGARRTCFQLVRKRRLPGHGPAGDRRRFRRRRRATQADGFLHDPEPMKTSSGS